MEAHLGDDAYIALREESVDGGTEAVAVLGPGLRARQRAHAGSHDVAVRQHDLEAAVRVEVIPEGAKV